MHLFCCEHSEIAASFGSVLCHNPMFRTRYLVTFPPLCNLDISHKYKHMFVCGVFMEYMV